MHLSDAGFTLLRQLEGSSAVPYQDVAGLWSIGVGHLLTRSELLSGKIVLEARRVLRYKDDPLSPGDIEALLRNDLQPVERVLAQRVYRPLLQRRYDALCSFCFNIGTGAFLASTLLKKLNMGLYDEVPSQMSRWVYAGGKVVQGLKNRREAEATMWEGRWHV